MQKFKFGKHLNEPVWLPKTRWHPRTIPPAMQTWLFDSTSLTQRLLECCAGRFRVVVISQARTAPLLNEARRLNMHWRATALIRQVHLLCNDVPWVFARTVIPITTLSGKQRRLARLGQKPLGAVLFADRSMRRDTMEVARIEPGQAIYQLAISQKPVRSIPIWGRRSVFYLNGYPLLVSEMFLPDIDKHP